MQTQKETTKMVAPTKVKIRMMRDAAIEGNIVKEGTVVEVTEEVAKEMCEVGFDGPPQFRGTRDANDPTAKPIKIYRAVRLQ